MSGVHNVGWTCQAVGMEIVATKRTAFVCDACARWDGQYLWLWEYRRCLYTEGLHWQNAKATKCPADREGLSAVGGTRRVQETVSFSLRVARLPEPCRLFSFHPGDQKTYELVRDAQWTGLTLVLPV